MEKLTKRLSIESTLFFLSLLAILFFRGFKYEGSLLSLLYLSPFLMIAFIPNILTRKIEEESKALFGIFFLCLVLRFNLAPNLEQLFCLLLFIFGFNHKKICVFLAFSICYFNPLYLICLPLYGHYLYPQNVGKKMCLGMALSFCVVAILLGHIVISVDHLLAIKDGILKPMNIVFLLGIVFFYAYDQYDYFIIFNIMLFLLFGLDATQINNSSNLLILFYLISYFVSKIMKLISKNKKDILLLLFVWLMFGGFY